MSHELSRISSNLLPELSEAPAANGACDLAKVSGPQPSTLLVQKVTALMAQTESRYPHQELDPVTARLYMAEWLEMAWRYGDESLAESLKAIFRDRERQNFFPAPDEIETRIREKIRSATERQKTLDELTALDKAKTIWMLERAEDLANGIERKVPATPAGPVPGARHTREEIAAYVAQHTTPEQVAEVRERMNALFATREEETQCA